jgi:hypothetical protein
VTGEVVVLGLRQRVAEAIFTAVTGGHNSPSELTDRVMAAVCDQAPLERCECGGCFDCPDGWHWGDDLPCACTPDCVLDRGPR